ncbi:hypothetical protein [Cohnella lupini]|uniref:Uncharacterized protein n=1 Tax=Cohnella lupini TaxID=1294267 RepID=A0A3D9I1W4_9BACL|nr:hypothetical protein [Cohnella lupini]RED55768.1 hypothetical protein DFP95_11694 [Cohnella lupini]
MPGLLRTINGTATLNATASLKTKHEGILSANIEFVTNPNRGISDFFLNVTQNACNLATVKLQSLTRSSSRLTAFFGKQVKGITSANIVFAEKNDDIIARGFINKKAIIPFKASCGCNRGCHCTGAKKVKFKDGTTLKICIDKSLELALERLFAKLERVIKRLIKRQNPGKGTDPACIARCLRAGTICQAACSIFAFICAPACLAVQAICVATC